jgi:Fur family ferric uptake transcriptional regulator
MITLYRLLSSYNTRMQRNTAQRRTIREAFAEAGRPLSVEEAHALAQQALPRMGIATVYRAANELEAEGWLKRVELPGEPVRYELADLDHHHHFHCTQCRRVFDVEGCGLDHDADVPAGFTVDHHEVILYGTCPACSSKR